MNVIHARQSQFGIERCKTNPIPGDAKWNEAPAAWDAGQMCKTNPIRLGLGRAGSPTGERCKTNPIWLGRQEGRSPGGKRCERNPISGDAGWGGAPAAWNAGQMRKTKPISEAVSSVRRIVQNEPNSARSAGTPIPGGRKCKTNPICPPGQRDVGRGRIVQNEPNLPGHVGDGRGPAPVAHAEPLGQNV